MSLEHARLELMFGAVVSLSVADACRIMDEHRIRLDCCLYKNVRWMKDRWRRMRTDGRGLLQSRMYTTWEWLDMHVEPPDNVYDWRLPVGP